MFLTQWQTICLQLAEMLKVQNSNYINK
jgi:hypothetical protein